MNIDRIDNKYTLETPEGVDLEIEVAGPLVRALALIVDTLIKTGIQIICWLLLSVFGQAGAGVMSVIFFLLEWFYPVLFEVYRKGQTPGKKALGIRVIHEDGTPVSWGASMLRNLLRVVDFLPFLYVSGLISMVFTKRFQRLGDLVGSTLVVYDDAQAVRTKKSGQTLVEPLEPPMPINSEEQVAIKALDDRMNHISSDRARELANLLEPLLKRKDDQAVTAVRRLAAWYKGE